ncbi:MAG: FGGY-family carbohydrate kinase [bacterium]|nr:FGGY-family carbohydrate kinase [bacterium]
MGNFLGIDSSTQSMTGLVIDTDTATIIAEVSVNFDDHYAQRYGVSNGVIDLGDGQMHSAPLMWAEALEQLCRQLSASGINLGTVDAIAGSGQQHGTVYLNDQAATTLSGLSAQADLAGQIERIFSRATAPIWMDRSTGEQCRQIEAGVGGRQALLQLTGNTAFERFSGPQIRRFWQTEPDAWERTANISLVSSFVSSLLAGRLVGVDAGDGSGTNLMDIRSRQWSPAALEATAPDLARRLLPVADAAAVVGVVHPFWVERHGFSPDCQVLPFSGDNPSSLIGLGLVQPGQVALSLGTSDTLFACMDQARVSTTGEGALFASPDGTHYMALICFLNGSLAREAVRDRYGLDWAGFAGALARSPAGNGGGLMLPWFAPEIVPHVSAARVIRHGLDEGVVDANVRAVIEAQALSSRIHSEWMGVAINSLNVTGGASTNRDILQIFADVHGCPVQPFETTNAAALGAALRAAHGHARARGAAQEWSAVVAPFTSPPAAMRVEPNTAHRGTYDALLASYRALEAQHAG